MSRLKNRNHGKSRSSSIYSGSWATMPTSASNGETCVGRSPPAGPPAMGITVIYSGREPHRPLAWAWRRDVSVFCTLLQRARGSPSARHRAFKPKKWLIPGSLHLIFNLLLRREMRCPRKRVRRQKRRTCLDKKKVSCCNSIMCTCSIGYIIFLYHCAQVGRGI